METSQTVAVFASEALTGDVGDGMAAFELGALLANNNVRLLVMSIEGDLCTPLMEGAQSAGGQVLIIADEELPGEAHSADCEIEIIAERPGRIERAAEMADAFIGLPASVAAAKDFFEVWVKAGGGSSGKPVALLNRERAYEVFRGYAQDVLGHSLSNIDRLISFADTTEELWARLEKNLD